MWKEIAHAAEVKEISSLSYDQPVLIFKHSTRCGISSMAKNRLERYWTDEDTERIQPWLLDLIRHRDISQAIADTFGVHHESPQVLLIVNGECIYDASHMGIDYLDIVQKAPAKA